MPASIFDEEWRDCLRAHYGVVVRNQDHVTEKTLRSVMFEAGFSDADLKQMYILATAHVDNVSEDFVPDMEFLEGKAEAQSEAPAEPSVAVVVPAIALPQEVIEAEIVEESVAMDEAADAESDDEAEQDEPDAQGDSDEAPTSDPDVTQLSLF